MRGTVSEASPAGAHQRVVDVLQGLAAETLPQRGRRPLGHHLSRPDEGDLLAERLRLLDVVGGQEDGRLLLGVEPPEIAPELMPELQVHARRRLIEHDQRRTVHERSGDEKAAAHAAGQTVRADVGLLAEVEDGQQFVGPSSSISLRHAEVSAVVDQALTGREETVEMHLLRRESDELAHNAGLGHSIVPEDEQVARRDAHQPGGRPDQRGLARAVGAQQPEERSRRDGEA